MASRAYPPSRLPDPSEIETPDHASGGQRHVPASHPVLQRMVSRPWVMPPTAQEIGNYTDRLDNIALLVRQLPDRPVTVAQQDRLRIIARELLRRADAP